MTATRAAQLVPLLLLMTVVTGLVDAVSYLALGRVFVANMTGNVVFLGFSWAGDGSLSATASLAALAAFLLGALAGGELAARRGAHRGRHLAEGAAVVVALLAAALVVAALAPTPWTGATRYALVAPLGLAMGLQNATARALAVPDATTTVLTLTLTGLAADVRRPGGSPRTSRRVASVLAMLVGALLGGLLVLHDHPVLALAAATLLTLGVAATCFGLARGTSPADWRAAA